MTEKLLIVPGSGNVFVDLGFSQLEANNLRLRSQLMMRIADAYRESRTPARALGLTPDRRRALLKGKIGRFTLDQLVEVAVRAGLRVRLVVTDHPRAH